MVAQLVRKEVKNLRKGLHIKKPCLLFTNHQLLENSCHALIGKEDRVSREKGEIIITRRHFNCGT
jgi:hypothetical protein